MKFIYPAIISKEADGTFRARFPDLDGCFAEGFSLDDCIENANEAANDWIGVELEENNPLPDITDLNDIVTDDNEVARNICINYRFYDGWDE